LLSQALLGRFPDLRIDVACSLRQKEAIPFEAGAAVRFHHGVMDPGVEWLADPGLYDEERLSGWIRRLAAWPELPRADLVLSDNLAGTLEVRPDAVLSGSFLWSGVLSAGHRDHPGVLAFARRERELLRRLRPAMLCNADAAMPDLTEFTRPVPTGWMCRRPRMPERRRAGGRGKVAVLGGAVQILFPTLVEAARRLAGEGNWVVAAGRDLLDRLPGPIKTNIIRFDFSESDFTGCIAVVGRPGLGLMTDCVDYGIPMIAIHEPGNAEMEHLGARVQALGFGRNLGARPSGDEIVAALRELERESESRSIRSRMASRNRDGVRESLEWIASRLRRP